MYRLKLSRREKKKLLQARWVFILLALLVLMLVVWLAWIRPIQNESKVRSFDECVAAGNPVQETYPEVCLIKNGKRFVNPKQHDAHAASLDGQDDLIPPSDPALLILDIDEWGARIPLTINTFDLTYAYVEDGGNEFVRLTYKRLIQMDVCKGDIGITLTRSYAQHSPPYTRKRPAPTAQIDKAYFYVEYDEKPCYDPKNAEQMNLVKTIAGDKTLTQSTMSLLTKMTAIPKQ